MLRPKSAGPGGTKYDPVAFDAAAMRSDLCRIAIDVDYRSGAKIVDALLEEYTFAPKKAKPWGPKPVSGD